MKRIEKMTNQQLLTYLMLIKQLMLIDKKEERQLILDIVEKLIKELK